MQSSATISFAFGALLAMTALANAQGTVKVPESITAGSDATVKYDNPSLANTTITIVVDDGDIWNPARVELSIDLDANGSGEVIWTVRDWDVANFNGPDASEVSRVVG